MLGPFYDHSSAWGWNSDGLNSCRIFKVNFFYRWLLEKVLYCKSHLFPNVVNTQLSQKLSLSFSNTKNLPPPLKKEMKIQILMGFYEHEVLTINWPKKAVICQGVENQLTKIICNCKMLGFYLGRSAGGEGILRWSLSTKVLCSPLDPCFLTMEKLFNNNG